MCLTIPAKIDKIDGGQAKLIDGRMVNINLIKEPRVGDWLLVNADLAVSKITAKQAKEINNYFKKN